MEEGSYASQLLAGLFFVVAGLRLIGLSRRTGESPERLLGLYFVSTGAAYVIWVLPYAVALGSLVVATELAAWIVYSIGVVPYLIFTRIVFRPAARWPHGLVIGCGLGLAISIAVFIARGDPYPALDDPFYWIQWLAYTLPCAWMTLEAALCRRNAVRRARIGLADPIVTNRYLLLAIFGGFQLFACLTDILLAIEFEASRTISTTADLLLGGFELAGIAAMWLTFFPPSAYRDWVAGSERTVDEVD